MSTGILNDAVEHPVRCVDAVDEVALMIWTESR